MDIKKLKRVTTAKLAAALGVILMFVGLFSPLGTEDGITYSTAELLNDMSAKIMVILTICIFLIVLCHLTEHRKLSIVFGLPVLLLILFLLAGVAEANKDYYAVQWHRGLPILIVGYIVMMIAAFMQPCEVRMRRYESIKKDNKTPSRFCKQCGAQLNDGESFCTRCGEKFI